MFFAKQDRLAKALASAGIADFGGKM